MEKITLPIDNYTNVIIEAVKQNPVTIITAETGSGKSTRIPIMVMANLGKPVIVTQPRRLAAETLARRVAEENGLVLGGLVDFRTRISEKDNPESFCLYTTDGLQLVRELFEAKQTANGGIVLVLDEVHEFSENIETLLAWSKDLIRKRSDVKIVIMSATVEHGSLSEYFDGAPVLSIPGKCFPVTGSPTSTKNPRQVAENLMRKEIEISVNAGRNTLVFLPGKTEISLLRRELEIFNLNVEIIDLHGGLEYFQQEAAFRSYPCPKLILATNIAQTSVTIPDIDCVIDSGYEKRIELWNGVETLVKRCISKSDAKQRAGRAGRTRPGLYVLCNNTPYEKFADYGIPEISQKHLDQMVLRLATAGFDATTLEFFHQPDSELLHESRKTLIGMEAMLEDGTVTDLGHQINQFPTSVMIARMILEGIKRKCLTRVLTIAAILSNSRATIKFQKNKYRECPADFRTWDEVLPLDKVYSSDLMAELDLWELAYHNFETLGQNGVDKRGYLDAVDIRKEFKTVVSRIGYNAGPEYNECAKDDIEVLKCVLAGMIHNVHSYVGKGKYSGSTVRSLSTDSVISREEFPALVVGMLYNISIAKKPKSKISTPIPILFNCTAVESNWLSEISPGMLQTIEQPVQWNNERCMLSIETVTYFNGREISRISTPVEYSKEVAYILKQNKNQNPKVLPEVKGEDYLNALYSFVQKRDATVTFSFEEIKTKTSPSFICACRFTYGNLDCTTKSVTGKRKSETKHNAAKIMYEKLKWIF